MQNFLSFAEARSIVFEHTAVLEPTTVPLVEAAGKVLASDLVATEHVPPFDNSAMDGFAVRAEDTTGASKDNPAVLRLKGRLHAGEWPDFRVEHGESIQIMTGAAMPPGADSVVMVEDAQVRDNTVIIFKEANKGDHRRAAGDDITSGERVFSKGRLLDSFDVGVAASLGVARVNVVPNPSVAIVSTGDELVIPGEPLPPGKIRASSTYALSASLSGLGCTVNDFGLIKDNPDLIRRAIQKAFECDIVLTTGGVSMGEHDYVRNALIEAGVDLKFWKVKQKPGKPLVFGTAGKKLFFGLPGNPVSTMLCYKLYVEPSIRKMSGQSDAELPHLQALLKDDIQSNKALTQFVRGRAFVEDNRIAVSVTPKQSSGVLSSLAFSNGLIMVPEGIDEIRAGSEVTVVLIRPLESVNQPPR